jgi:hypothetical protein
VFNAPYFHCHSAPYRRSAVTHNVPDPRKASRQNYAAGSQFSHFKRVLYPSSYCKHQEPLMNKSRYFRNVVHLVQNSCKILAVTAITLLPPLHTCQNINVGCIVRV